MLEFFSSDFVKLTVPLIAAVVAWFWNERQKQKQEQYARKEEKYKALISALQGFYEGSQDTEKKRSFLEQLNQCWLYCPDEVIQKANDFLEKVENGDDDRSRACADFVAAIRRDMLSRKIVRGTRLDGQQFKHFQAR